MKRFIFLTILFSTCWVYPAFAKESVAVGSEPMVTKQESKPLSSKEVSTGMAEVWCQKMSECADGAMEVQECRKVLFKSFKQGFDNIPKDTKLSVTPETYGQCVKSIRAGNCQSLKASQTLVGCEFISLLNR